MTTLDEIYQVESFYMGMEDPYTGDDADYDDIVLEEDFEEDFEEDV